MRIGYAKFLFRVFVFKLASTFPEYSRWCKAIGWNEEKEMNWMIKRKIVKFEESGPKTKLPNMILIDFGKYYFHSFNDEPAVISSSTGCKYWYKEGNKHREGTTESLPAVIYSNGDMEWYKEGKIHREGDKPAVIWSNGSKIWYKEGKRHRDGDDPAVIEYYNGNRNYIKEWWKKGKLHRDGDEPAVIWDDGDMEWYKEGVKSRIPKKYGGR